MRDLDDEELVPLARLDPNGAAYAELYRRYARMLAWRARRSAGAFEAEVVAHDSIMRAVATFDVGKRPSFAAYVGYLCRTESINAIRRVTAHKTAITLRALAPSAEHDPLDEALASAPSTEALATDQADVLADAVAARIDVRFARNARQRRIHHAIFEYRRTLAAGSFESIPSTQAELADRLGCSSQDLSRAVGIIQQLTAEERDRLWGDQ